MFPFYYSNVQVPKSNELTLNCALSRSEEVGDLAPDMSDEDISDDDRFPGDGDSSDNKSFRGDCFSTRPCCASQFSSCCSLPLCEAGGDINSDEGSEATGDLCKVFTMSRLFSERSESTRAAS